jgi:hypothetical protein
VKRPNLALRLAAAAVLAVAIAACAPAPPAPAKPVAPQITEETLRARAKEQFAAGLKLYEGGDYEGAQKSLAGSLDHGLLSRSEQGIVRKHLAFMSCMAGREGTCRDEFRKAFEIDPGFALTTAEDGHPIWGPVYRDVRAQLIVEREAASGKPAAPMSKPEKTLADGMLKYDAGDFPEALRLFEASLKEGLKARSDQLLAIKQGAFCLCLMGRPAPCRAQFLKAFEIDADFNLAPAEAGHPSWNKVFASARAQAKLAQSEKHAKPRADAPRPPAATVQAPTAPPPAQKSSP